MTPEVLRSNAQIKTLLLQGSCDKDIAADLHMTLRAVKDRMHKMFRQYAITSGVKRVRLAVLLYRNQSEGNR